MAYPMTHLYVAQSMLMEFDIEDGGMFLLGSIAPDAVHFRSCFKGAGQAEIGAAKKITHLCPKSDEKWGQVTDNLGWEKSVEDFLERGQKDSFRMGYAVHVLTDIYTNKTIWHRYRTNHPQEASKGYSGGYYDDLRSIDKMLKKNLEYSEPIHTKLLAAIPVGIDDLVSSDEVLAIRQSLLEEIAPYLCKLRYSGAKSGVKLELADIGKSNKLPDARFVSFDEMLIFIDEAVTFCSRVVL